jgi:hypothetical protein
MRAPAAWNGNGISAFKPCAEAVATAAIAAAAAIITLNAVRFIVVSSYAPE